MAAAVPFIMMAGAAMSAYGAVKQGQAAQAASLYNAKVSENNAAAMAAQGDAAAEALDRDQRRRIGAMVAGYGASGVQLSDGSPSDVLADSVRGATLDKLTLKYNYKMRALGYSSQAGLDHMNADYSSEAGRIGAASALLNGAGNAYTKFGG